MYSTRMKPQTTHRTVLHCPDGEDYALLNSGDGAKLERFGPYTLRLTRSRHLGVFPENAVHRTINLERRFAVRSKLRGIETSPHAEKLPGRHSPFTQEDMI